MKNLQVLAPAKINLSLNIFPKKINGLYQIKFLNCQIALSDKLFFEEIDTGIQFKCQNSLVPKNGENLIARAAKILKEKFKIKKGIKITLIKNIPIRAGLGGGSSDAAATLFGLNKLWRLKLKEEELVNLASKIGKDVCYLIIGGLALIDKTYENIKRLPFLIPKLPLIIVVPKLTKPSTGWAYQNLNQGKIGKNEDKLKRLVEAIKKKNLSEIGENLHNDFEYLIEEKYPQILEIKNYLIANGALGAILAGAGLSVFGIFEDEKTAKKAKEKIKRELQGNYNQVILTKFLN